MNTPAHTDLERVATRDGTATLRWRGRDVSYRSLLGARTESEDVYLRGARLLQRRDRWLIAELGFGAATTFAAVVREAFARDVRVEYWGVERAPVPGPLVCGDGPGANLARFALTRAREEGARTTTATMGPVTLHLVVGDWIGAPLPGELDAVFFDPFAPDIEPASWSEDSFFVASSCLSEMGVLVTSQPTSPAICRAMGQAGLTVATLPAIGGATATIAGRTFEAIAHGSRDKAAS